MWKGAIRGAVLTRHAAEAWEGAGQGDGGYEGGKLIRVVKGLYETAADGLRRRVGSAGWHRPT